MRNGNQIWLSEDAGKKFLNEIANLDNGHCFIYIGELDRSINTADVSEVMTEEQMADKARIDAGDYKCRFERWHSKREKCICQEQIEKERKQKKEDAENKPISDEQKKKNLVIIKKMTKELKDKKVI